MPHQDVLWLSLLQSISLVSFFCKIRLKSWSKQKTRVAWTFEGWRTSGLEWWQCDMREGTGRLESDNQDAVSVLLPPSSLAFGKMFHFSEPWFPHLKWEYSHQSPSLNQDFYGNGYYSHQAHISDTKTAVEELTMELRPSHQHMDLSTPVPTNTWLKKMSQSMMAVKATYQQSW